MTAARPVRTLFSAFPFSAKLRAALAAACMASLLGTFEESVARPSGQAGLKYPSVSLALSNAAHDVLGRKATPEAAVRKLEGQLKLVRRERW